MKKSILISSAVLAGALQAAPRAFDLPGAVAAAGRGLMGGGVGDRLAGFVAETAGWTACAAFRAVPAFIMWTMVFLVLFYAAKTLSGRFRKPAGIAAGVIWLWMCLSGAGAARSAWSARITDPVLLVPDALVEAARKTGGRVFVNPSGLVPAAAAWGAGATALQAGEKLHQMVRSPSVWREEDRRNPFSAVLLTGNVAEARALIRHLQEAPDWYPARIDNLGVVFLHGDKVNGQAEPAPEFSSDAGRALYLSQLALVQDALGDKNLANQLMDEALDAGGRIPAVLTNAASLAASQGRWERALKNAAKALRQDPDGFEPRYLMACALLETSAFEKAYGMASALASEYPDDPAVLLLRARAARATKNFSVETAVLEQLLRVAADDPASAARVRIYLGQSWAQRGFPDQALENYRLALAAGLTPAEARGVREAIQTIEANRLKTSSEGKKDAKEDDRNASAERF